MVLGASSVSAESLQRGSLGSEPLCFVDNNGGVHLIEFAEDFGLLGAGSNKSVYGAKVKACLEKPDGLQFINIGDDVALGICKNRDSSFKNDYKIYNCFQSLGLPVFDWYMASPSRDCEGGVVSNLVLMPNLATNGRIVIDQSYVASPEIKDILSQNVDSIIEQFKAIIQKCVKDDCAISVDFDNYWLILDQNNCTVMLADYTQNWEFEPTNRRCLEPVERFRKIRTLYLQHRIMAWFDNGLTPYPDRLLNSKAYKKVEMEFEK